MIKEYVVVNNTNLNSLVEEVNKRIIEGRQPFCDLKETIYPDNVNVYYQPMIKDL